VGKVDGNDKEENEVEYEEEEVGLRAEEG